MRLKRGSFILVVCAIIALTILAFFVNGDNNEGNNGFLGHYDVSSEGMIAYVNYADGVPEIRLYQPDQNEEEIVLQLDKDNVILDPTFSNNDSAITYILTNKNMEEDLTSSVRRLTLETLQDNVLFTVPAAITEIEISAASDSIFYLRADVFQNYSPIASKRPHDFDLYEYSIADDKHIRHTNYKEYSMSSLQLADDGMSAFVQMGDVVDNSSESFQVVERIFNIPLAEPNKREVVSDPERNVDIWGFAVAPNSDDIIFQSVANWDSGNTFQYELYTYNTDTNEEDQLTYLKSYAGNPKIISEDKKIYFVVDDKFGQNKSNYSIYKMNMNGTKLEKIYLPGILK